jgi:hypothetical protein
MIETSLFFRDVADEAQLIFLAGFHMGIPVSIIDDLCKPLGESTTYRYCSDNAFVFSPGHDTISSDLNCKFQESGKFDIILQEYAPSVTFPLGKPLIIC